MLYILFLILDQNIYKRLIMNSGAFFKTIDNNFQNKLGYTSKLLDSFNMERAIPSGVFANLFKLKFAVILVFTNPGVIA